MKAIAKTLQGWTLYKGDTVRRKCDSTQLVLVGRENNLIVARPLVGVGVIPANMRLDSVPTIKVHPSEVGLRSNVTPPDYVPSPTV